MTVDDLMKAAFCRPRADRSPEYKAGVRALLSHRIDGIKLDCPRAAGTAQSDAFWSGVDEGRKIWSDVQAHHPQLAIAAATEFKYLLDVQPAGRLFNPGGTGDARASAGYAQASGLLAQAVSKSDDGSARPGTVLLSVVPIGDLVSNDGTDTPAEALDILQRVREFLLAQGFEVCDQHAGGAENGGTFKVRFSAPRQIDQIAELAEGKFGAVHDGVPVKVDGLPLCHAASCGQQFVAPTDRAAQ